MPYQVADRGRQCPPTLPIEYAREPNSSNNANNASSILTSSDLHQGQEASSIAIACQGVDSSVCSAHDNRALRIEEAQESLEKSRISSGEQVSSLGVKRPFPGHNFSSNNSTTGGGDNSSTPSFRSKKRSWHRRPRGGPYRPRGNTFDHANSTSSSGPNANSNSKPTEPMDQENSSHTQQHKRHRHRNHKPYAAPPCNTTQFLMDDHNFRERDFEEVDKLLRESPFARPSAATAAASPREASGAESDDFYSSPDDENEFQQRQFSQVYEYVHAERLSSMSKSELVQEYILLEEKVEDLEKKLKDTKTALSEMARKCESDSSELSILREKVDSLTDEKTHLTCPSQQPPQQQQQQQQKVLQSSSQPQLHHQEQHHPQLQQQQPPPPPSPTPQQAVTSISSTSITSSDSPGQTVIN